MQPRSAAPTDPSLLRADLLVAKKLRNKLGKKCATCGTENKDALMATKREADRNVQILQESLNKVLKKDVAAIVHKSDDGTIGLLKKKHPFVSSFTEGRCPVLQKNLSTLEICTSARDARVRRPDGQGWTSELDSENELLEKLYYDLLYNERKGRKNEQVDKISGMVLKSWQDTGGPATIADFVNANRARFFVAEAPVDKADAALRSAEQSFAEGHDLRTVGSSMAMAVLGDGKTMEEAFGEMHVDKNGFARPDSLPAALLFDKRFGEPSAARCDRFETNKAN